MKTTKSGRTWFGRTILPASLLALALGFGAVGSMPSFAAVSSTPAAAPTLATASDTGSSTSDGITSDTTPTINYSGITSGTANVVTVTATKASASDVTCTETVASGTSGSCTLGAIAAGTWSITFTQDVDADTVSAASPALSITVDATAPTIAISSAAAASKTSPISFTLTDSVAGSAMDVSTVAAADFAVTNGTIGTITCAIGVCTIPVTATAQGDVVIDDAASPSVADMAGNTATSFGASYTVKYDTTAPTVSTFARSSAASAKPGDSITYDLVFSESVTGLTTADFTVGGTSTGWTAAVAGSGTTYVVTLTGAAATSGTVTLTLKSAAVADVAANDLVAAATASGGVTVDSAVPTATVTRQGTGALSVGDSIVYDVVFSENVTGLTDVDFSTSGTATGWTAAVSGENKAYTVTLTGGGAGTLVLTIGANKVTDASSNTGPAAAVSASSVTIGTATDSYTAIKKNSDSSTLVFVSLNATAPHTAVTYTITSASGRKPDVVIGKTGSEAYCTVTWDATADTGTITPVAAGTCTLSVGAIAASGDWSAIAGKDFDVQVVANGAKAAQTISTTYGAAAWSSSTDKKIVAVAGTSSEILATANSGLTVAVSAAPSTLCTYSAATHKVTGLAGQNGDCILTFSQAGDTSYSAATSVTRTVTFGTGTGASTISVAGSIFAQGSTVSYTGTGWALSAKVTSVSLIYFGTTKAQTTIPTATAAGAISGSVVLPTGVIGTVRLQVVGLDSAGATATKYVDLVVDKDGNAATVGEVAVADTAVKPSASVTVYGAGWTAAATVTFALTGPSGVTMPTISSATVATDGSWSKTFSIPSTAGTYVLTATGDKAGAAEVAPAAVGSTTLTFIATAAPATVFDGFGNSLGGTLLMVIIAAGLAGALMVARRRTA